MSLWTLCCFEGRSSSQRQISPFNTREDIHREGEVDSINLQIYSNIYMGIDTDIDHIEDVAINGDGKVDQDDIQHIVQKILGFNNL